VLYQAELHPEAARNDTHLSGPQPDGVLHGREKRRLAGIMLARAESKAGIAAAFSAPVTLGSRARGDACRPQGRSYSLLQAVVPDQPQLLLGPCQVGDLAVFVYPRIFFARKRDDLSVPFRDRGGRS